MYADDVTPVDTVLRSIHIIPTDVENSVVSSWIRPKNTARVWTARFHCYLRVLTMLAVCSAKVVPAQTSIVILMDDNHIVVAADSKQSSSPAPFCKIHQSGKIFWAIAGLAHTSSGYDPGQMANPAIREGRTVAGALAYFRKMAPPILGKELALDRKAAPELYKQYRAGIGLEIAFFAMENGAPALAFINYKTEDRPDGSVSVVEDENGVYPPCPKDSSYACGRLLGVRDAARDYLNSHKGDWWKDLSGYAKKMVEVEIKDSPEWVGPPISVLRIGTGENGAFWIDRNNCPEIKKPAQTKSKGKGSGRKR
jgi:hypothetical protein